MYFTCTRRSLQMEEKSVDPWTFWSTTVTLRGEDIADVGKVFPIPRLRADEFIRLCHRAEEILKSRDTVVDIPSSTYIIGDLHGNLHDLLRILSTTGLPPCSHLLFLGDFVDRGQYSAETLALLFTLLVTFPEYVVLLRGNHEFANINAQYGFKEELEDIYKEDAARVYEAANSAFEWLPLAAIVQEKIFCVHGGISRRVHSVDQIRGLTRPIEKYSGIVSDLVWSDPASNSSQAGENSRGQGCIFNQITTWQFLEDNNLDRLVRSHQCVAEGIYHSHRHKVCTVFSSSCYSCTESGLPNKSAILKVTDGKIESTEFPPVTTWPARKEACFRVSRRCCKAEEVHSFKLFDTRGTTTLCTSRHTFARDFLPKLTGVAPSGSVRVMRKTATASRETRSCSDMNPCLARATQVFGASHRPYMLNLARASQL